MKPVRNRSRATGKLAPNPTTKPRANCSDQASQSVPGLSCFWLAAVLTGDVWLRFMGKAVVHTPNDKYRTSAGIHRGRVEPQETSAPPTVNNCAGARSPQHDSGGFRDPI